MELPPSELGEWEAMVERMARTTEEVRIAAVGKYTGHDDAYKSINEAFVHAGIANDCKVRLTWIDSERLEKGEEPDQLLPPFDGVLVGPGFGNRGIEGKIKAVRFVRERRIPFLGICLGMQIAAIEIARDLLGLAEANSTEFEPETPHPVISLLTEQRGVRDMGGTMRLGAYRCELQPGTRARAAYGADVIHERHRHRYEFNNEYLEAMTARAGAVVSGIHPHGDHQLVEIIELRDHPWFCASQFHPEFKSTPLKPQPLFREFVRAALEQRKNRA